MLLFEEKIILKHAIRQQARQLLLNIKIVERGIHMYITKTFHVAVKEKADDKHTACEISRVQLLIRSPHPPNKSIIKNSTSTLRQTRQKPLVPAEAIFT